MYNTHARACSILRKESVEFETCTFALKDDHSWSVVKLLNKFPQVIEIAFNKK